MSREHGAAVDRDVHQLSSTESNANAGGRQDGSIKDKSFERKRWTPPKHGGIGASASFGHRSGHIRFDARVDLAHRNKRRRRGS